MEKALRKRLPHGRFSGVSATRSKAMSAVRSRGNRTTEWRLRSALMRAGMAGWQMHPKEVLGTPDFVFSDARLAVFVDGCFWHGCRRCRHALKTRSAFWAAKIDRNRQRDRQNADRLRRKGYQVIRFWEHQLQEDLAGCVRRVAHAIGAR